MACVEAGAWGAWLGSNEMPWSSAGAHLKVLVALPVTGHDVVALSLQTLAQM